MSNLIKIGVTIIGIIILVIMVNTAISDSKSESLGNLVNEWDSLRNLKEKCVNDLGIQESKHFLNKEPGYCDQRDEEIINLKNQINEITKKDYEGLW